MKTTTNTGRNILSSDDIAATCGDADCATSDAEMTPADEAMVALVAGEVLAADASPYAHWPAEARAAQEALDAKRETFRVAYAAAQPAREEAARVAVLAKAPAGSVVCPCCGRAVTVKDGRIVRHGFKGARNGYTGPMATGMTFNGRQSLPCEGTGKAA